MVDDDVSDDNDGDMTSLPTKKIHSMSINVLGPSTPLLLELGPHLLRKISGSSMSKDFTRIAAAWCQTKQQKKVQKHQEVPPQTDPKTDER